MGHRFITADGRLIARWQSAFEDAIALTPEEAPRGLAPGDIAWLTTGVAQWQGRVAALLEGGAQVVVMSDTPHDREALSALNAGARGYVHRLAAPAVLRQVAQVVQHRGIWVGQELLERVLQGSARRLRGGIEADTTGRDELLGPLTERERDVALAVAGGASNKEIARALDITERTVKAHLSATFRKLAVRDRLQLILKLAPFAERRSDAP